MRSSLLSLLMCFSCLGLATLPSQNLIPSGFQIVSSSEGNHIFGGGPGNCTFTGGVASGCCAGHQGNFSNSTSGTGLTGSATYSGWCDPSYPFYCYATGVKGCNSGVSL